MTPSSATNSHIAIHIAVLLLSNPMADALSTNIGNTAASTIWPDACNIRRPARPCGKERWTPICATQSATRLATHNPPVASTTSSTRVHGLVSTVV